MRLGDRVRVARKLIPEWVLSKVQDHTQLDGIAVLEHCDDDGIVYLRLSGLGLPFRAGNPWMENGPVFAIGEQVFVVSAYHGEIVDAE